ncbi:MAG: ABC transporter ATP-binding protein [Ardenticatenaceae bacterium]|nr:ABC transporter ATP-binding protein [Ardenticatenaceae bacterium]
MTHLLEVRNLVTKFYTQEGIVHAVNGISYTLDKGESMAIVGESGCGKSVGALSIVRLVPTPPGLIEAGEVLFNGEDLLRLPARQMRQIRGNKIGMIFQDPMTSLNPVLTIGRQVGESMKLHLNLGAEEARKRTIELLERVGIPNPEGRINDYPHQFSGGQRQRLMIAIALACNPSLLIADEPTTALDVTIQAQIIGLIKSLKADLGMSIIWITHDLGVVASLVDKVVVMYAGHIVESAPVNSLYKKTSHPYTLGLLESLPQLDAKEKKRLIPIKGLPPDLRTDIQYCPFAERCRFAIEQCWQEKPPLTLAGPFHMSACWRWQEVRDKKIAL